MLGIFGRVSGDASGAPVPSLLSAAGKVAFALALAAAHEPRGIREGELRYLVS